MQYHEIHLKDRFPILGENGCDPKLTVYAPYLMAYMPQPAWEQPRPVVLICPGGAYGDNSIREAEPIALRFLCAGYNAAVLNYSCAPNRFPTQLRQVAAALEMIHENAEKWHCNPQKIAILGFSAGGHLAGHYTNCFDIPEVREVFPESKPVQASILCYPVISADPAFSHGGSFRNLSGHDVLTEQDIAKFSLENHVSERTPPTFLWHTAEDQGVSVMNSLVYAQKLAQYKRPFSVHIYPHGGHGLSTGDEHTNQVLDPKAFQVQDWLDAVMKWLKVTFE